MSAAFDLDDHVCPNLLIPEDMFDPLEMPFNMRA